MSIIIVIKTVSQSLNLCWMVCCSIYYVKCYNLQPTCETVTDYVTFCFFCFFSFKTQDVPFSMSMFNILCCIKVTSIFHISCFPEFVFSIHWNFFGKTYFQCFISWTDCTISHSFLFIHIKWNKAYSDLGP